MADQITKLKTWRYALAGLLGLVLVWPISSALGIDERFSFPTSIALHFAVGAAVGLVVLGILTLLRPRAKKSLS